MEEFSTLNFFYMTTTNDFLPDTYEIPSTWSSFTKIVTDIELRIRIVSKPITGYSYYSVWSNGKKTQIHSKECPDKLISPAINKFTNKPEIAQEFWAMKVYNYNTKQVELFETTKTPIKTAILALARDPDYGSPKNYDIKIKKTWVDKDTKYSVLPAPAKPLDIEIEVLCDDTYVNLEALYTGWNVFVREVVSVNDWDENTKWVEWFTK